MILHRLVSHLYTMTSMAHRKEEASWMVWVRIQLIILQFVSCMDIIILTTAHQGAAEFEYYSRQTSARPCMEIITWQTSSRIRCALSCYRHEDCPGMCEGFTHENQTCFLCLSCTIEEPASITQMAHPCLAIHYPGKGRFITESKPSCGDL